MNQDPQTLPNPLLIFDDHDLNSNTTLSDC
jgi:hypothetical protein